MNINVEAIEKAVLAALEQTGENYMAVQLSINANKIGLKPEVKSSWTSYTPNSGHCRGHATPEAAIAETLFACSDPAKLMNQAAKLEDEARQLRARVKGGAS